MTEPSKPADPSSSGEPSEVERLLNPREIEAMIASVQLAGSQTPWPADVELCNAAAVRLYELAATLRATIEERGFIRERQEWGVKRMEWYGDQLVAVHSALSSLAEQVEQLPAVYGYRPKESLDRKAVLSLILSAQRGLNQEKQNAD